MNVDDHISAINHSHNNDDCEQGLKGQRHKEMVPINLGACPQEKLQAMDALTPDVIASEPRSTFFHLIVL